MYDIGKAWAPPRQLLEAGRRREGHRIALAVYGVTALLNHACAPSVALRFRGGALAVRAVAPLAPGDRLLHCYGPQVGTWHLPRQRKQGRCQIIRTSGRGCVLRLDGWGCRRLFASAGCQRALRRLTRALIAGGRAHDPAAAASAEKRVPL